MTFTIPSTLLILILAVWFFGIIWMIFDLISDLLRDWWANRLDPINNQADPNT